MSPVRALEAKTNENLGKEELQSEHHPFTRPLKSTRGAFVDQYHQMPQKSSNRCPCPCLLIQD